MLSKPEQVIDSVREIISSKQWYKLTDSGAFSFEISTGDIAEKLRGNFGWGDHHLVKEALKEAITPDYLILADKQKPLIQALADLKKKGQVKNVFLWTLGDQLWQEHKMTASGAIKYVPKEDWRIARHRKSEAIKDYLALDQGKNTTILAFDDKQETISLVADLGIATFLFNPKDPITSSQQLLSQIEKLKIQTVFADFDMGVYDTERALTERGTALIVAKHAGKSL